MMVQNYDERLRQLQDHAEPVFLPRMRAIIALRCLFCGRPAHRPVRPALRT